MVRNMVPALKIIDDEIEKLEKLKIDMLKEKRKGGKDMKIAVSAAGKGLDSQVDIRFGRCPNFVIAEMEDHEIKNASDLENTAVAQMGGAGITAAQLVADQGVQAVITGNMGPRAFAVFQQLGIKIYQGSGTVREVLQKFAKGELEEIRDATGPMFMGRPGGAGDGQGRGTGRGPEQ